MKQTFTWLIFFCSFFQFLGCTPKQSFFFNGAENATAYQHKNQEKQERNKTADLIFVADKTETKDLHNDYPITALNQQDISNPDSSIPNKVWLEKQVPLNALRAPLNTKVYLGQKELKTRPKIKQEFLKQILEDKPTHKLAKWGLMLGLGALVLFLIGSITSAAIPYILSFLMSIAGIITSISSLNKIKKQKEQYGGKGLALTGLVISGILSLLFVAFILFILSFAGAFS